MAQDDTPAFSFDALTEAMAERAHRPYARPQPVELPEILTGLDYDRYNWIAYRADRALWRDAGSLFGVQAYHPGGLFLDPVEVYDISGGAAEPHEFRSRDFHYGGGFTGQIDPRTELSAVAGIRLHHPLNRPDFSDEVVSFLGASYFRALGRGNVYGVSARGLAIDTGLEEAPDFPRIEEFPRFDAFYLERPAPGSAEAVIYATLDGPSVTGAYRFAVTPGETTVMDVTSRLFFRTDIVQLGIAPLTSMFLYAQTNRTDFDDFRPQVHDSDGLRIVRRTGETVWRPLNNPPALAQSYFGETSPRRFGLHQRDRDFANHQDAVAEYHLRPSLDVEPVGDWGAGHVRLIEIPTAYETIDNIVSFWTPERPALAGERHDYRYRLHWGLLPQSDAEDEAYVFETRAGQSGISGGPGTPGHRKFVVDFKGGRLGLLPRDAILATVPSISGGDFVSTAIGKIAGTDIWRLVLDVRAHGAGPVEMSTYIVGFDQKLSETWVYQWLPR